jgi:hypothetical protein
MPVVNLAETTYGFFIPSVTLMGPGCAKEVGPKAKELGGKYPPAKPGALWVNRSKRWAQTLGRLKAAS